MHFNIGRSITPELWQFGIPATIDGDLRLSIEAARPVVKSGLGSLGFLFLRYTASWFLVRQAHRACDRQMIKWSEAAILRDIDMSENDSGSSGDNVVPFKRPASIKKGPGRRRQSSEINANSDFVDGFSSYSASPYKPGQNVICRILGHEPGGYKVIVPKDNQPGFLPSENMHEPGKEVLAQFVCMDKNRVLLSERFTAGAAGKVSQIQPKRPASIEQGPVQLHQSSEISEDSELEDGSSSYSTSPYKPGQVLICRIVGRGPDGYTVVVVKDKLHGFLPSENKFEIGNEVKAQFVCMDKKRLLLSDRLLHLNPRGDDSQ